MKIILKRAVIVGCLVIISSLTSCFSDFVPMIPSFWYRDITVDPAMLYEELGINENMKSLLDNNISVVTDTVLIYDAKGKLVQKVGAETVKLEPLTIEADVLADGEYTLVVWQTKRDTNGRTPWYASGEDQLSTVSISTDYVALNSSWTLGVAGTTISVRNGSFKASLTPRTTGSIIRQRIDNLTEDKGFYELLLDGPLDQFYSGVRLDPSLDASERRIKNTLYEYNDITWAEPGYTDDKFFTLNFGENQDFALIGLKENGDEIEITSIESGTLGFGENVVFYYNMDRHDWQPPFYGSPEDFDPWIADREAGILVAQPLLKWGCNLDEVQRHIEAKPWWRLGNKELEFWGEYYQCWHKWYYVAPKLTEQYLFETEDGKNLRYAYVNSWDVPIDLAVTSFQNQGYQYKGKGKFWEDDPAGDIYLSADGQTEVLLVDDEEGWYAIFRPAR